MNAPKEIAIMFDKRLTHFSLAKKNIPVPRAFYSIGNYEELVQVMTSEDIKRAFVKLSNGSSASGVVVVVTYLT